MQLGSHHRVTGLLGKCERGLILNVDDGDIFALDADEEAQRLLGTRVTVDGIRSGFDRLDVQWIGPAARMEAISG